MSGAEVLVHGVLLPIYVALYMSVDVPIIVAKATKYHFKYTKPRDKFGQHLIESLTMLKERYQHLNALHHTHSDVRLFVFKLSF